jgi:hypothetical protein
MEVEEKLFVLFFPVGDRSSRKAIEEKNAKIAKDLEQEQTEETERYKQKRRGRLNRRPQSSRRL